MQNLAPRPAITHNIPIPEYYSRMFDRTEIQEPERSPIEMVETELRLSGSYRRFTQLRSLSDAQVDVTIKFKQRVERQLSEKQFMKAQFRALAVRLGADHPGISTDTEVLGGTPHIKGTRLSVRTILGKLYVLGSIQAIVDSYEPHLSEEQIKEAIAYAQAFLEIACAPNEP
jgi:uncharacterized protein (DUF433 family)